MKTATQVYFDDIQSEILRQLRNARYSIKAAVAWLTDQEILQALTSKARDGVAVELILSKVSLNDFDLNPFEFYSLQQAGGAVFQYGAADFREGSVMHNKFVVIDFRVVITGSYNWTRQARRNEENIVVFKEEAQAELFVEQFESLKANSTVFGATDDETDLGIVFTCTKNLVDPGQTFELHWEAYNAEQVTIDKGIGVVPSKGNREVQIQSDTYFNLEAVGLGGVQRKSLLVKTIQKPTLKYWVTILEPGTGHQITLMPSSPLLDTYSVIMGMNLTVHWEANHVEILKIDGREVEPEYRSFSFVCDRYRSITLEVFGIKHRITKSFSVIPIPVPKIDRVTSPLPGDIKIYGEFDFFKVDVPSSLSIFGNELSIRIPNIRQLKAKLVGRHFRPSVRTLEVKVARFNLPQRAKGNKERLREHLLSVFKDGNTNSLFLKKMLKRYE